MSFPNAAKIIQDKISSLEGVKTEPHKFGGIEFKFRKRELGHLHYNHLLDLPLPLKIKQQLIKENRVKPHHILPKSDWVSFYIAIIKKI